jgi:hypothetical protein
VQFLNKNNQILPLEIKVEKESRKIEYEFQQLGIEMQPMYGKAVWSLFYKYPLSKIKDADKICRERGITKIPYLIGVIKRLK